MMRTAILLLLPLFFGSMTTAQEIHAYNPVVDATHYTFNIALTDQDDEIKASAAVSLVFLQAANAVELDLIGKDRDGKGMTVTMVKEHNQSLAFEQSAGKLIIKLTGAARVGDTAFYTIAYHGVPANGLVFSKNKFGQRTIFGDNWPNRAHHWLPCVDHPSDKVSVDFLVTAPDHYQVISNGLLIEESALGGHQKLTHWQETVALPTKVMVIGLAEFAVNYAGMVDCIPVSSWVFPKDRRNGFYDYAQALEILPFFIKNVGSFAYKKLANVEAITIFGGMENASAIFYNEQTITGKRSFEATVAHEIAHQWFGNSATESGWPHVWLSEGFATAMSNFYLESKYGPDTLKARLADARKLVVRLSKTRFTPVVDSSETKNFLALLNNNSYEKGSWILYMLRRQLGDSIFWKGVRTYYFTYAGYNASTDDFRKIMEDASQTNLKEFFQQWLYTAGQPNLRISWKYDAKKKAVAVRITQEQEKLFSFPLELALFENGIMKQAGATFSIKERVTEIAIESPTRPAKLLTDPNVHLLFEGTTVEEK